MVITIEVMASGKCRAYYDNREVDPDCVLFKILNKPISEWGNEFWSAISDDGCDYADLLVAVVGECRVPLPQCEKSDVKSMYFDGRKCREEYHDWLCNHGYENIVPEDLFHTREDYRSVPPVRDVSDKHLDDTVKGFADELYTKNDQSKHKSKKAVASLRRRIRAGVRDLDLGDAQTTSVPGRSVGCGDVTASEKDTGSVIGGGDLLPRDDSQKDLDANTDGSEAQSTEEIVIYRKHLASLPAENSKFQKCFMVGDAKQLCKETGSDFVKLFVMRCTGSDLLYRYKLLALLPDEREFAYCVLVVDPRIEDFLQDDDGGVFCALVIPKE